MKLVGSFFILAGALCAFAGQTLAMNADPAQIDAVFKSAPTDVVELVRRGLDCQYWSTVEISDEPSDTAVSRALDDLNCGSLDADFAVLRLKYAQSPTLLRALTSAHERFP